MSGKTFHVAPMMDWTDRHCRFFHRLLSRRAVLWTEMVTALAIIHGDRARLLDFDAAEHPLVLQLGGADPDQLAEAARIGAAWGYDEINLNCGCPSDRVQGGQFGACLMAEPALVARCIDAMKRATHVPVSVKCRIGIDDQDPEEALFGLVSRLIDVGVDSVTVHARKAWLQGLSPKENREVPPLDYAIVNRLKAAHPALPVIVNGGITTLGEASGHLDHLDGVMLGRAAYQTPGLLLGVDPAFNEEPAPLADEIDVVAATRPYIERHLAGGGRLYSVARHMLGLFAGQPGARAWRRHLATEAIRPGAGFDVLERALEPIHRGRAARGWPEAA